MEEIYFDKEGRDKLLNGINKLNQAVGSTMGPMGKTVIIPDKDNPGKYKVTKDGVSVANSIRFKDAVEDIGAELIKQAANKTVDEAGDGTTTSTVLATAFVNNLKDFNSININKAFDEIIPKVIEELRKNSRQLKNEDIKYVATISANNDMEIGSLIQQAYDFSSIIKVEEGGDKDKLELIEGMSLNTSYISKDFITNKRKGESELNNPHVLLLEAKLDNIKPFIHIIETIAERNEELLIITEHVHESILRRLEDNVVNRGLKLSIIKSPGFSKHRKDLLKDISTFIGAHLINDLSVNYSMDVLGRLKSFKASKNTSILIKEDNIDLTNIIEELKEYSKSIELTSYDKELLEQRISNLTGKVAIIKVGGRSEIEMKERKDRYDDAVLAVACALEEGIVEGGGKALEQTLKSFLNQINISIDIDNPQYISEADINSIEGSIALSLLKPFQQIIKNGSEININENMFDLNIIDPLKVTRCALENAVSVAKTILSTEAIVLNYLEWKQ